MRPPRAQPAGALHTSTRPPRGPGGPGGCRAASPARRAESVEGVLGRGALLRPATAVAGPRRARPRGRAERAPAGTANRDLSISVGGLCGAPLRPATMVAGPRWDSPRKGDPPRAAREGPPHFHTATSGPRGAGRVPCRQPSLARGIGGGCMRSNGPASPCHSRGGASVGRSEWARGAHARGDGEPRSFDLSRRSRRGPASPGHSGGGASEGQTEGANPSSERRACSRGRRTGIFRSQ